MTQLAGLLAQAMPGDPDWTWLAVAAAVAVLFAVVFVALRKKKPPEALPGAEAPARRIEPERAPERVEPVREPTVAEEPDEEAGEEAWELREEAEEEALEEEAAPVRPVKVVEKAPEKVVEKAPEKVVEKAPEKVVEKAPEKVVETKPVVVEKAPEKVAEKKPAVVERVPERVEPVEKPGKPVEPVEKPTSLKDGLGRTRKEGFIARLGGLFSSGKKLDRDLLDELEEVLFTADIGVRTADRLLESVRESLGRSDLKDASRVWGVLRDEAKTILHGAAAKDGAGTPAPGMPRVIMVLGVNGTGKTTSIGKLAHKHTAEGKKVVLIAGDTFRAAAAEQLEHWGRRVGVAVMRGKEGADPASVVFDGLKKAVDEKADVVLVDTAGRLHTQVNLMEELRKVRRVMSRAVPDAPHEVYMVLDATTGQNAVQQAKMFKEATDVTGIVLTKLDGTAKGGVVIGVCDELAIPIKYIGIGERVADLRPFEPDEFVEALFTPPSDA